MEPVRQGVENERALVLEKAASKAKAKDGNWRSYNGNVQTSAKIANLSKNFDEIVAYVLKAFYDFNKANPNKAPLTAVPVSGWLTDVPTEGVGGFLSCFGTKEQAERVEAEYGASYSFNYFISTLGADMILLVSRSAHYILEVKGKPDQYKVSAGVQVTEFDEFLRKRGKAAPSSSTIHRVAWSGGLGTGFYWPSKIDGPGSTHVLKMKVIDAKGIKRKLSPKHHPHLFHALVHAHLGAGFFLAEIRIGEIVNNYLVKRTNTLYKNVRDLKEKTKEINLLDAESFMFQWFPYDATDKASGHQIRVTLCERTNDIPSEATKVRPYTVSEVWKKLMITEASEYIIEAIAGNEKLRKFYPLITQAAAFDTFGSEERTVEVGDAATIMHPFKTYTDQEMSDVNPCILVKDTREANKLWRELLDICDAFYKETNALYQFNIVARLVKGIPDPAGIRGIAPCIVDNPGELKLAFEVLEHEALAHTDGAKELRKRIFNHLSSHKFVLHHGKTPVEGIETLEKQFNKDELSKKRLAAFREAVIELGGDHSSLLTKKKRAYIFSKEAETHEKHKERLLAPKQKGQDKVHEVAPEKIVELFKEDPELLNRAKKLIAE